MSWPLITVGITSYNSKDSIAEAIDSALAQDYPAVEVLVVDDASPDGSGEYLESLQGTRRFRLVRLPKNGGVANARNVLIAEAQGEFLAFFDDDDISMPTRVRRQYEALLAAEARHGNNLASYVARLQRYQDGKEIYEPALFMPGRDDVSPSEVVRWALLGRYASPLQGAAGSGTTMARIEVFRSVGGYDQEFKRYSDTDFLVRFAQREGRVVSLQEPLMVQRMTVGSDKNAETQRRSADQLMQKHTGYLERQGLLGLARLWMEVRFGVMGRQYRQVALSLLQMACRYPGAFLGACVVAWKRREAIRSRLALQRKETT